MARSGFTLVELLVVVSIIVVLLALLAPAMDRAIYQAELAACAAQQDGIGSGAVLYAMNNARHYPYRAGTNEATSGNYFPMYITLPFNPNHNRGSLAGYDDRTLLRPYMNINAMLDPLSPGKVDLDGSAADSFICTSYSLWFGWKNLDETGTGGARGLERYGQPWGWMGQSYSVLLGDTHGMWTSGFGRLDVYAHADRAARATEHVRREEAWNGGPPVGTDKNTVSLWLLSLGPPEGPQIDANYTYEDGSVRRYADVWLDIPWFKAWGKETRFDAVPAYHRVTTSNQPPNNAWLAVPNDK